MDASGVPAPKMDWESGNIPEAWKKFKQHLELMFSGPLKSKKEEEKCSYLLLWTNSAPHGEKKKKESILDLSKYLDKPIRVKFSGGREASGVLKGFDPLLNLVLDGTTEFLRDPDDPYKLTDDTRQLGLVVCRGTSVTLICPADGLEAIENPFTQHE